MNHVIYFTQSQLIFPKTNEHQSACRNDLLKQTEFSLVQDQAEDGEYNRILVGLTKIGGQFRIVFTIEPFDLYFDVHLFLQAATFV